MSIINHSLYSRIFKRYFDFLIALLLLVTLMPLIVFIGLIIFLDDGRPIIHKRRSFGQNRDEFQMYKFRTMVKDADLVLEEWKLENNQQWLDYQKNIKLGLGKDPRITLIGKFLRKASFDELPQLFNVLRGEMSLIGPRPIIQEEEKKITPENLEKRYQVKPGISGLWQVSGRQDVSYIERQKLDLEYVENITFKNDMYIFFKTILTVMNQKGAA